MNIMEEKEYNILMSKWYNYEKLTCEEENRRIELISLKFKESSPKSFKTWMKRLIGS